MRALLVTVGSSGDVHPFVGLGRTLAARGHDVSVVTNNHFQSLIRSAGLNFIDSSSDLDFQSLLDDKRLWDPYQGPRFVLKHAVAPVVRPIYEVIRDHYVPCETVVAGSSLAFGARVAQDHLGVPTATVHLAPSIFRSDRAGVKLPGTFMPDWLPAPLKRLQYRLADVILDSVLGPSVNQLRAELGLPRVRRLMHEWWNSPQLVIAAFPEWFAPRQPDWPKQTVLSGFPLYDEADVVEPSPEVRAFVEHGPGPIAFTPGSANVHGREFFEAAIDATARLGRRAILLTRFPQQLPTSLPEHVRHFEFVPFGWLLPRIGAAVHHGGVGSTAQGLAAGRPQLLMPLGFDQFDNAARVKKMGVGDWLLPRQFTGARVAERLGRLLESAEVAQACKRVAELSRQQRATDVMSDVLERLFAESNGGNPTAVSAAASPLPSRRCSLLRLRRAC
jgi:UDP:flavonoid glycosyltransferase YjiC (YdhE family)